MLSGERPADDAGAAGVDARGARHGQEVARGGAVALEEGRSRRRELGAEKNL